ncbi:MAG: Bax inhibitor-1/YccA family protein [Alphaproteobacteria bacterium]|nr:Bax inhibitor-1/YccA family protein [Alphaproteobacteria bacterium]MBO4642991.1 Bax inhibitor-1/YccA family protein [Alphaproteobacteria bacterium]
MSFNSDRDFIISRTSSAVEIDEGLRQYMLKVYNYMTIGLLITAGVSYLLANSGLGAMFFMPETGEPNALGWIAIIAPFFLVFMMGSAVTSGNAAKAFVLFILYSGLMGVSLTTIFWAYTGLSILRVFLITAGMFAGMSLYGYTTKRDLTKMGAFMMMGLIGIIIAAVVNIFLRSPALYFAVSVCSVVVFVGLTAWDTWKIREVYNEHDSENMMTSKAICGALQLYLDFINLFITLLRFFGDRKN